MKKIITLILIGVVTIVFATSCHKYEDGGYASKSKLCKTWKLDKIAINGQEMSINDINTLLPTLFPIEETEITSFSIESISVTFKKDGTGNYDFKIKFAGIASISQITNFKWEWINGKESIKITTESNNNSTSGIIDMMPQDDTKILKLTKDEFWFSGKVKSEDVTEENIMIAKFVR